MITDKRTRARLADTTRFGDIREFETIDSTNRYLLGQARGGAPEGVVVVAGHQTAGRGRLGRSWEAPAGTSLLVSILLRPTRLPAGHRHLALAAVALAAADACLAVAGVGPDLKWPNDLLVDDRKLAGLLAEAEGSAIVVGLGLNVAWAPPGAACLSERPGGGPVDPGRLLATLLEELEGWYGRWDEVASAYRRRCATVGRRVRVDLGARSLLGVAEGVDGHGHLLLRVDTGELVEVTAGDVVHLRPGQAPEPDGPSLGVES